MPNSLKVKPTLTPAILHGFHNNPSGTFINCSPHSFWHLLKQMRITCLEAEPLANSHWPPFRHGDVSSRMLHEQRCLRKGRASWRQNGRIKTYQLLSLSILSWLTRYAQRNSLILPIFKTHESFFVY